MSVRIFPPSPRRVAAARRAGIVPRSRVLTGGLAAGAAIAAIALGASHAATVLSSAATRFAGDTAVASLWPALWLTLQVALPIVGIVALAAWLGHAAQLRALVAPRRRVEGAPAPERGVGVRLVDLAVATAAFAAITLGALAWLFHRRDHLIPLFSLAESASAPLALWLLLSACAFLAAVTVTFGVVDLGLEHLRHRAHLRMTREELEVDRRSSGATRATARARNATRWGSTGTVDDAVKASHLIVSGAGGIAVAITADVFARVAARATAAGTTRMLALARRHHIPIWYAPALADALHHLTPGAPVPTELANVLSRRRVSPTPPAPR